MTVRSEKVQYTHDGVVFEAVVACDDADATPKPAVLVAHTIRGRTEFEEQKARDWAAQRLCRFCGRRLRRRSTGRRRRKGRASNMDVTDIGNRTLCCRQGLSAALEVPGLAARMWTAGASQQPVTVSAACACWTWSRIGGAHPRRWSVFTDCFMPPDNTVPQTVVGRRSAGVAWLGRSALATPDCGAGH